MDKKFLKIRMDHREDERIRKILHEKYRIQAIKDHLPIGDYILGSGIVIERKTTVDFAKSIIDGRLFQQAFKMKQKFDFAFFIIEGLSLFSFSHKIHFRSIHGAIVSLALAWRIPILFTREIKETCLLLWLILSQSNEIYLGEIRRKGYFSPYGRKPKRPYKKQLHILQGLPQVGPKMAQRLLDYYGNVESVMTASKESLVQIPRIGKQKAEQIRQILTRSF